MTSSNRTQLTFVRESTPGTTPNTPRMRTMRLTSESLSFTPEYVDSDEIRADRMLGDPIKVMQASTGGVNFELSYPDDLTPMSEIFMSAFFNSWTNSKQLDNIGTAASVITSVSAAGSPDAGVYNFATQGGSPDASYFPTGGLVRATNFTSAANNQIFRVSAGTQTSVTGSLAPVTDASPAATARLKLVGFQGVASDITATATGLGCTALDFTRFGLAVGQWIKVGGTASVDKFAVSTFNDWIRITAITATTLTCDNLPTGWTTDTGAGKTIKVWFGDQIKNGTTLNSLSIEKGFLGQTVPTYIVNTGMQVNTLEINMTSRQKITGASNFMGMGGGESTTTLDASVDAATTGAIMAANANVGRLAENGSTLTSPNWSKSIQITINNNLRTIEAVDQASPVAVRDGECTVTAKIDTYFGSDTLLAKLYSGAVTSLNARVSKNSQALIFQLPRATLKSGAPAAGGKNQDVMLSADVSASIDTTTNAVVILDRVEYFE